MNHPSIRLFLPVLLLLVLPACRTSNPPPPELTAEITFAPDPSPATPGPSISGDASSGGDLLAAPRDKSSANLYILRWNPAISSFTDATFREGFDRLRDDGDARTNWSIHDWSSVSPGDWAIFARVGGGATDGIAGLCRFLSPAYEGASWRGDGSTVHYADIDILLFNDPALSDLFAAAELDAAFPDIDWHGGHSGILLDPDVAAPLALYIADRLARLGDGTLPSDALAAAPLDGDGPRAIAIALLSGLCPGSDAALVLPAFSPDDAAFAAGLLRAAAEPGQNAVVSPLGADTLLSALALGARGSAAEDLSDLFGTDGEPDGWADRIRRNRFAVDRNRALLRIARSPELFESAPVPQYAADAGAPADAAPAFDLGTRLFFRTLDGLAPGYADLCCVEALDIPLLPAPPGIDFPDPSGNPVVARADLDFRARWQTPFDPVDTLPSTFHAPSGDLRVPFMNRFGNIAVKKLPGTRWTAFTLPYAGCDLELLLLLPPRGATPEDLQSGLADALSAEWCTPAPSPTPAFLTMPRIAFPADAPDPDLRSLGLGSLCTPGTRDLATVNPASHPYLHSVLQSLPFTATESGTAPLPSAALDPADTNTASAAKSQRLLLNRPFAFALRDTRTGLLLLLGQLFTPPE